MLALLLPVSAIVPSLLLMRYFQSSTRWPVPAPTLWRVFGLGALSVLGIVLIFPLSTAIDAFENPWLVGTLRAFFVAAIPEELLKLGVLFVYVFRHPDFRTPIDGMIYGAAASLGFATLENVLYVMDGDFSTAALRALTAVPAHAFSGAILGYYVARYRGDGRTQTLVEGTLAVMTLHGLYDAPLLITKAMQDGYKASSSERALLGLAIVVVSLGALVTEIVWARSILKRLRDAQDGPATRARAERGAIERALQTSTTVDAVLMALGGLLASLGGMFVLAMAATALLGRAFEPDVLLGGLILGGPALAVGVWMFLRGMKRQAARHAAQRGKVLEPQRAF